MWACPCADICARTKEKRTTYADWTAISPGGNKREKQKSAEESFILPYANRDPNQKLQHSRLGEVIKHDSE